MIPRAQRLPAIVAAILAAACDNGALPPPPPPVRAASIALGPESASVFAGDSLQITATPRSADSLDLTGLPLTWTSRNPGIATVTSSGLVRGINAGVDTIVVTADSATASATITVTPVVLQSVSAGADHSCALANNGAIYCWGYDFYGQAGVGFYSALIGTPFPVATSLRFTTLSAGGDHTCALASGGAAHCWGQGGAGELGGGPPTGTRNIPGAVATSNTFVSITSGGAHTCAIAADSLAYCWGANTNGQLGDDSAGGSARPQAVAGGLRFGAITAGDTHTCALASDGTAYCWGANARGELGDSTTTTRPTPTHVGLDTTYAFAAIAAGGFHTCAIAAGGAAYCWGAGARGQLGIGTTDSATTPAAVTGGLRFLAITAGEAFSCGIGTDSLAYCWGANDAGQLGDSSTTERHAPVAVHGGLHFATIEAGGRHVCAVTVDSVAYCWGNGTEGELGDNNATTSTIPVRVAGQ